MKSANQSNSWHYSQDAQQMLKVSVAQIKSILNDGGESVSELTESFIELAQTLNDLIEHKTDIDHADLKAIKHKIEQGIIAFQFYDRISQRLDHVSNSLQYMGDIIKDDEKRQSQNEWSDFQVSIKSRYTMESERKLFHDILSGIPIETALETAKSTDNTDSNSIELF